ncbi:MAG: hypothetical protein A2176_06940 [Spirochaetes bacterium RBG_13_51_14]|nr:MAG: hypothetical protein A2176_06940 [Spirochaetes bacterium RBG_13_51_14]
MSNRTHTRRDFLKNAAASAAAGALFLNAPEELAPQAGAKSRVILIRNRNLLDAGGAPRKEVVRQMLDDAVASLLGEKEPLTAWRRLVKPSDVVGVKTNEWSYLRTPVEVEDAIKRRIMDAGVPAGNISISDRGVRGDDIFEKATALVNVRPMRTHHWAGVGSLIKNYIVFSRLPFTHHGDSCADLAEIWSFPEIRGKTRLNILVMFTPLFHGIGPHHFNRTYVWPYQGLLVGTDPVAVDSTGVRILLAKRRRYFREDRPLSPPPKHVFLADTRHHLGTADPNRIELVKLGWKDDVLI